LLKPHCLDVLPGLILTVDVSCTGYKAFAFSVRPNQRIPIFGKINI
jgi:hypothetical protein